MITREEARALAANVVANPAVQAAFVAAHEALGRYGNKSSDPRESFREIFDEATLELPFAWVFFHGSRSGPIYGGPGPIIVSCDGRVMDGGNDYIGVYLRKFGTLGLGPYGPVRPRESR